MRFVYNDPYALRGAVERLVGEQPIATRRERELPIPGKGYREIGVESNQGKGRSK